MDRTKRTLNGDVPSMGSVSDKNIIYSMRLFLLLLAALFLTPAHGAGDINITINAVSGHGSTSSPVVVVDYVEITMPNGSGSQTVALDEPSLYALARFKYQGNGPLTVRWLVDGRVITQSIKTLTYGTSVEIRSDAGGVPLPTFEPGPHEVTLTFDNGSGQPSVLNIPVVKYFVAENVTSAVKPQIELLTPFPNNRLNPMNLRFNWHALPEFPVPFERYRLALQKMKVRDTGSLTRNTNVSNTGSNNVLFGSAGNTFTNTSTVPPIGGLQLINKKNTVDGNRYLPVLSVELQQPKYVPPATDLLNLKRGRYRWRVTGFVNNEQPVISDWQELDLTSPPTEGSVFIKSVFVRQKTDNQPITDVVSVSQENNRQLESRQIDDNLNSPVSPGQDYIVAVDLRNSSFSEQDDLQLELWDDDGLISRKRLPAIPASVFTGAARDYELLTGMVWSVPVINSNGRLTVKLKKANYELDSASLNWQSSVTRLTSGFDFQEYDGEPLHSPPVRSDGLPSRLEMAGFELQVLRYEAGSSLQQGFTGQAQVFWKGDKNKTPITLNFYKIHATLLDASRAQVEGGTAKQDDQTPNLVLLDGNGQHHRFKLYALFLDAFSAKASLTWSSAQHLPGGVSNIPEIKMNDVRIWNGGEFVCEMKIAEDYADIQVSEMLALRLASADFIADFSSHLGYDAYGDRAQWMGVGLASGMLRIALRRLPEDPLHSLFDVVNSKRGYLTGRFNFLELKPGQGFFGKVNVVAASAVTPFFNQAMDSVLKPLTTFGFGISFDGGEFDMDGLQVGGLNLSGRLYLPESYHNTYIDFQSFSRRFSENTFAGFQTEILSNNLPALNMGGYNYQPASARFLIPWRLKSSRSFSDNLSAVSNLRQHQPQDVDVWAEELRQQLVMKTDGGLLLYGGDLQPQWETAKPPRRNPSSSGTGLSSMEISSIVLGGSMQSLTGFEQNGAFLLGSEGLTGNWIRGRESGLKKLAEFNARIDHSWLSFKNSALLDSEVKGTIMLPYPVAQGLPFNASLDLDAKIMVQQLSLPGDEANGLLLDYWKARLITTADELQLYDDYIQIREAKMWLEVDEAHGGREFFASDGSEPFKVGLKILPNGNIDNVQLYARASSGTGSGRIFMAGAQGATAIQFLGLNFTPMSMDGSDSPFSFRRYAGETVEETSGSSDWRVRITGKIAFGLFGERDVKILHTSLGASVPFIETRESGVSDSSGTLELFTQKLRFINTFRRSADFINSKISQSQSDVVDTSDNRDNSFVNPVLNASSFHNFKAFIGKTEISVLNTLTVNGLSEAGMADIDGRIQSYEKIGIGGGVDAVKAVLAGLRGMRTAAKITGSGVEIMTGVEGTGKDVVNLVVEATSIISDVVTITGSAGATAGSGGGTAAWTADEIRNVVGDGIGLAHSAIALSNRIYQQMDGYEADNLIAILLKVTEIGLDAANMLVLMEDIDPERIARLTLDTAGESIRVIKFAIPSEEQLQQLALELGGLLVKIPRYKLDYGEITGQPLYDILTDAFSSGERLQQLVGTQLDARLASFLSLAISLSKDIVETGKRHGQVKVDPDLVIKVSHDVFDYLCRNENVVGALAHLTGTIIDADQATKGSMSKGAMGAVAAGQMFIARLEDFRQRIKVTPVIPQEVYVTDYINPLIDQLTGVSAPAAGSCSQTPLSGDAQSVLLVLKAFLNTAIHLKEGDKGFAGDVLRFLREIAALLNRHNTNTGESVAGLPVSPRRMEQVLGDSADAIDPPNETPITDPDKAKMESSIKLVRAVYPLLEDAARDSGDQNIQTGSQMGAALIDAAAKAVEQSQSLDQATLIGLVQQLARNAAGFDHLGNIPIGEKQRAALMLVVQSLEVVRQGMLNNGAITPEQLLKATDNILATVEKGLGDELDPLQKDILALSRLIVAQSIQVFNAEPSPLSIAEALVHGAADIIGVDDQTRGALEGFMATSEQIPVSPAGSSQQALALITTDLIDRALLAKPSTAVANELKLARGQLSMVAMDACDKQCSYDESGKLKSCECKDTQGVRRIINYITGGYQVDYPQGNADYPHGFSATMMFNELDPQVADCIPPANAHPYSILSIDSMDNDGNRIIWDGHKLTVSKDDSAGQYRDVPSESWCSAYRDSMRRKDCPTVTVYDGEQDIRLEADGQISYTPGGNISFMQTYNESLGSCLEYDASTQEVTRYWNEGAETVYKLNHPLENLDNVATALQNTQIQYHADCVNWPTISVDGELMLTADYDKVNGISYLVGTDNLTAVYGKEKLISVMPIDPISLRDTPPVGMLSSKIFVDGDVKDTFYYQAGLHRRDMPGRHEFRSFDATETGSPSELDPNHLPAINPDSNPELYHFSFWSDDQGNMFDAVTNQPIEQTIVLAGITFTPGSTRATDANGNEIFTLDEQGTVDKTAGQTVKNYQENGIAVTEWSDSAGLHKLKKISKIISEETVKAADNTLTVIRTTLVNDVKHVTRNITHPDGRRETCRWQGNTGCQQGTARSINTNGDVLSMEVNGQPLNKPPEINPGRNLATMTILAAAKALETAIVVSPSPEMLARLDTLIFKALENNAQTVVPYLAYIKVRLLNLLIKNEVKRLGALSSNLPLMRGYMGLCDSIERDKQAGLNPPDCQRDDKGYPAANVYNYMTQAEKLNDLLDDRTPVLVDYSLVSGLLAPSLGDIYLSVKVYHDKTPYPGDLIILGKLAEYAQSGVIQEEDTAQVFGTDNVTEATEEMQVAICVAASSDVDRIRNQLASGRTVATPLDLKGNVFSRGSGQLSACPTKDECESSPDACKKYTDAGYKPENLQHEVTEEINKAVEKELCGDKGCVDANVERESIYSEIDRMYNCGDENRESQWLYDDRLRQGIDDKAAKVTDTSSVEEDLKNGYAIDRDARRSRTAEQIEDGSYALLNRNSLYRFNRSERLANETAAQREERRRKANCPPEGWNQWSKGREGNPNHKQTRRKAKEKRDKIAKKVRQKCIKNKDKACLDKVKKFEKEGKRVYDEDEDTGTTGTGGNNICPTPNLASDTAREIENLADLAVTASLAKDSSYQGRVAEIRLWLDYRQQEGLTKCDGSRVCKDVMNNWLSDKIDQVEQVEQDSRGIPTAQGIKNVSAAVKLMQDLKLTICPQVLSKLKALQKKAGSGADGAADGEALLAALQQLADLLAKSVMAAGGAIVGAPAVAFIYAYCQPEFQQFTDNIENISLNDPETGVDQIVRMSKVGLTACLKRNYRKRRDKMQTEKSLTSIGFFVRWRDLISVLQAGGTVDNNFYARSGFISDDPFGPLEAVLKDVIDNASSCLSSRSCNQNNVKGLIAIAAMAARAGHEQQTKRAMDLALQMLQQLIDVNLQLPDLSDMLPDLSALLTVSAELRDKVLQMLEQMVDWLIDQGETASDQLKKFLINLKQLQAISIQIALPDLDLSQLQALLDRIQAQLAAWLADLSRLLASLEGNIGDFSLALDRQLDDSQFLNVNIAWPAFQPFTVDMSCTDRSALAMKHLKNAARLAGNSKGDTLAKVAETVYQDRIQVDFGDNRIVAVTATARSGAFLAQVMSSRVSGELQPLINSLVNTAIELASTAESVKQPMQNLLQNLLVDFGEDASQALKMAQNILPSLLEGASNNGNGLNVNDLFVQLKTGLSNGSDALTQGLADAMTNVENVPTGNLGGAGAVLYVVGQFLQNPIAGWMDEIGAPPVVPEIIRVSGSVLKLANSPNFFVEAGVKVSSLMASAIFADNKVMDSSFDWAANYLKNNRRQRNLLQLLVGLQDVNGFQALDKRLKEDADIKAPLVVVRIPVAGVVEMLNQAQNLNTSGQEVRALAHISAAVLNQALPAVADYKCTMASNIQIHPMACLIHAVAEAGEKSDPEIAIAKAGINVVRVIEDWLLPDEAPAASDGGTNTGNNNTEQSTEPSASKSMRISPILDLLLKASTIKGNDPAIVALKALDKLPELTEKTLALMNNAPPQWQAVMQLIAADCEKNNTLRLVPPDICSSNGMNNLLLAALEEARISLLQSHNLSVPEGHLNDADWGYLKTVPILTPPEGNDGNALSLLPGLEAGLNEENWQALGDNLQEPEKAVVAGIDLARVFLNLAANLDQTVTSNRFGSDIIHESLFGGLVGDEAGFFTGIAGGLVNSGAAGGRLQNVQFDMLGQVKIPALATTASQISFANSSETRSWGLSIRSGGNVPDLGNLTDSFEGVNAAAGIFNLVAGNLDKKTSVQYIVDGFMGESNGKVKISLKSYLRLSMFGNELIEAGLSGQLETPDMTGELCLEASSSNGTRLVQPFIGPLMGGFFPVAEVGGSAGGRLWHYPGSDGTGLGLMAGVKYTAGLSFLGFDVANMTLGIEAGGFGNVGQSSSLGMCLTPYIRGTFGPYTFEPGTEIIPFVKEYKVGGEQRVGLGLVTSLYTGETDNNGEKKFINFWLFSDSNNVQYGGLGMIDHNGIKDRFPRKGDHVRCSSNPFNPFNPFCDVGDWGGMPTKVPGLCDPDKVCGYQAQW